MNILEILKAGRARIATRETWTQGYYAYNADGEMTEATGPDAVCFCSIGALEAVSGKECYNPGFPTAAYELLSDTAGEHMPNFNDEHTHAEVLAVWDAAIATAEAAQ